MKQFLPVVWWLTATLVIAFVLVGLGYLFADALLLGVLFLPGMAHGALLRAAAVVRKPAAGNPRHRLPCAGDPRHRIPLADAGPCGGARRRRRRNAGAAAQPALHPAGPDGPHRSGNSSRKTPRTPLSLRPVRSVSSPTAAKSRSTPAEISYVESNDSEVWIHTAGTSPTAPKPAFRNGRHSWTAVSCASTARSSSTRRASTAAARHTWRSAASRSKSRANTGRPRADGSQSRPQTPNFGS